MKTSIDTLMNVGMPILSLEHQNTTYALNGKTLCEPNTSTGRFAVRTNEAAFSILESGALGISIGREKSRTRFVLSRQKCDEVCTS